MGTAADFGAVLDGVARYYTGKVSLHGATPRGVDWAGAESQESRFVQLLKLCDFSAPFSLNDHGCGWGALAGFLRRRHRRTAVDYLGFDISAAMVEQAQMKCKRPHDTRFTVSATSPRQADYAVASGIFNVKLRYPARVWAAYVATVLDDLHANATRGFAVNFLAPPGDGGERVKELYRPPQRLWAAHCERRFAARVEVVEGYGLPEYTLLVRPQACAS